MAPSRSLDVQNRDAVSSSYCVSRHLQNHLSKSGATESGVSSCCTILAPNFAKRSPSQEREGLLPAGLCFATFFCYSHSMVTVLLSRHSSCTQFSVSSRTECRQITPCRVSSASGTKAGTISKTFFKLSILSFCFCPKGRGRPPLEARFRRKRPF